MSVALTLRNVVFGTPMRRAPASPELAGFIAWYARWREGRAGWSWANYEAIHDALIDLGPPVEVAAHGYFARHDGSGNFDVFRSQTEVEGGE